MAMGMAMMHGDDRAHASMGIEAAPNSAKAGEVTFSVVNSSGDLVHEMVVPPVADINVPLPHIESEGRVDEDAVGHQGEVAELEPGQRGGLTLTLRLCAYILYGNVAGHYAAGMWTLFTVAP